MRILVSDDDVKVDDANVVQTDIIASNGVIHIIDSVVLPDLAPTAVEAERLGAVKQDVAK